MQEIIELTVLKTGSMFLLWLTYSWAGSLTEKIEMRRKLISLVCLSLVNLLILSCLNRLGTELPPLNTRKLKTKVAPPGDINSLVLSYRRDYGYWPKSETDLTAFNRSVVNKLYDSGFNSWSLGYFSDDTLYIHFVHDPVFKDAHFGGVPIPGKEVRIRTRYIISTGVIKTEFDKKLSD